MTAAELNSLAAATAEDVALVRGVTEQHKLTGLAFDYDAPLPDLNIRHARSWEPAARHYRDIEEQS